MNPQYSGASVLPPGPTTQTVSYCSEPLSQTYNGYEQHSSSGFGQPGIPTKGLPQTPYATANAHAIQNGPAVRQVNSYTMPPYSQSTSSQMQPMLVPPSVAQMNASSDQMSQQFSEISLTDTKSNTIYPLPVSSHMQPQRLPGPLSESYRLSQQDSVRPNLQNSFQAVPPPPPPFNMTSQPSLPPVSGSTLAGTTQPFQNDMGLKYSTMTGHVPPLHSAPPPPPPPSSSGGMYNSHSLGPSPSDITGHPLPDMSQSHHPYSVDNSGAINLPPYNSHANGPSMSPGYGQYAQMGGQPRYPIVSQPQSLGPGLSPQPPLSPQGMGSLQNRMAAPMPSTSQPQVKRLDPDLMPSPIQVVEENRKDHSGDFSTGTRGQLPPLCTTDFITIDEGICSPRFMRSTIYTVPTTSELLKQTCVPFALSISPFAELKEKEQAPPISNLAESGPVRCNRCKAYMCPFMQFIDGGRRFQCVFCKATTEVPPEYFVHLDHMGNRVDKYQRPELCLGSYEFIATKEYCKNSVFPNNPAFIFVIDVSYNSVQNGMLHLLCSNMKSILAGIPREDDEKPPVIKVGFITYSNVVHFYNTKSTLSQPQMMVISDVQDMFVPLLDGFLCDIAEAESVIDSLLEQIPTMFEGTRETETVLGPAIQAGLEAVKAADCSGKLFVFHSTLPIAEAPGKLKNRDDRKLLGTEKEKAVLTPQIQFYNNLGQECVAAGCCIDMFIFPNAYIDVATLGQVCRLTGGQLYKYTYFHVDVDGERFLEDIKRDVAKLIAFDAIIRVRTSTGIRPTEFWGNFFMANTTDIEVAAIDCDKAIAVEIKYDDKLGEEDGAYIQTAVLFTSCGGQRRLRVHNLALNTSSQMADLFRSCELDTIMNVFSKEAIRMIIEQTPRQVKDHYVARCAQILACYRKHCASRSAAGQLILPECMKLLPLYTNCLIKCDAIAGSQDISVDDRSFAMLALNSMTVEASACYLYPRLLPLHELDQMPESELPVAIRCSIERIKEHGAYLLENGMVMYMWIGGGINVQWLQDVFAVQSVARIDIEKTPLLVLSTPLSKAIQRVLNFVQRQRQRHMKLIIMRQGDKTEILFRQLLVEDRTTENSSSYVDFLCHLHKEIRALLS